MQCRQGSKVSVILIILLRVGLSGSEAISLVQQTKLELLARGWTATVSSPHEELDVERHERRMHVSCRKFKRSMRYNLNQLLSAPFTLLDTEISLMDSKLCQSFLSSQQLWQVHLRVATKGSRIRRKMKPRSECHQGVNIQAADHTRSHFACTDSARHTFLTQFCPSLANIAVSVCSFRCRERSPTVRVKTRASQQLFVFVLSCLQLPPRIGVE